MGAKLQEIGQEMFSKTFLHTIVVLIRELKQATFNFCQHGSQPEVNRVVIDGECWRQPFSFEITNLKAECLPLLISNENG